MIIPYEDCVELAKLKCKKKIQGFESFTSFEKRLWQALLLKEKHANEIGRAWIEERTGITVWTRPTVGYVIKKFLGLKIKPESRWRA